MAAPIPAPLQAQQINNPNRGGMFSSTPPSVTQLPTMNQQQQGLQSNLINQTPNVLQQLLQGFQPQNQNQFDFAPIAQQARTNFKTQTVPGLAERFGALAGDSRGSSGVFGQLGAAGAGLDEGLASLQQHYGLQQQQFGQQQQSQFLQLLQMLLQGGFGRNFENIYDPGANSGIGQAAIGLSSGIGQGVGALGALGAKSLMGL